MEAKPDTIKISESQREEIFASHADLFVSVRGSSFVGGDEALKKAREVSQLVEALRAAGVDSESIHLLGVQFESAGGALLKSSSATYRLRVRCQKLDQLAALLDVIGSHKNAALERIEWKYPELAARERGLEAVIASARSKADKVAAALGVRLLGVYDFIENVYDEEARFPYPAQAMELRARGGPAEIPSLGFDVQHSKTIHVSVEIWYRVSAF
jgi:uncharacterized protein YggE